MWAVFWEYAANSRHILCEDIELVLGRFSAFASKPLEDVGEILQTLNLEEGKLQSVIYEGMHRLKSAFYEDMGAFETLRTKVDNKIIELIESIEDFKSIETFTFPGVEFKKSRGFFILALLNHATHHRGQIAGALDMLKIENDFNGMFG